MVNFFVKIRGIFAVIIFILVWCFMGYETTNIQLWLAYAIAIAVLLFAFFILEDIEKTKKIVKKIITLGRRYWKLST